MKNSITIFLFFLGLNSMAQTEDLLNKLFDKKWTVKTYEIGGQSFPSADDEKDDYTIFYIDHSVTSVNRGITILSMRKYDTIQSTLILYSKEVKEATIMKIEELNDTAFVWQTANPEGMMMKIHMSILVERK